MIQIIDFFFSVFIWFSPWADADQPFNEMGVVGTMKFYMDYSLYVLVLVGVCDIRTYRHNTEHETNN